MKTGSTLATALVVAALPALYGCNDSNPVHTSGQEVAAASTASFTARAGGPTYRRQIRDDYASFSGFDWSDDSMTWMWIWVERGSGTTDAWLGFSGDRCITTGDEWWEWECEWFYGSGPIPASDVKGNAQTGIRLETDLRSNSQFQLWGMDPGPISVQWSATGWAETRESGSREDRWMHTVVRSSGVRRSKDATASGSLLDRPLPQHGWGSINSGRGAWMEFERATR